MVNKGGSGGMVPDSWFSWRLRRVNKGGRVGMDPDSLLL